MTTALKTSDIYNVIIGTAGHIDHGKSTLVKRLTGIDPDRLPEEKEREMTIDLGFAPFVLKNGQRVGIIDVPGHERFIKNMVAGATSIDIVLLIVAADESINLQTREHVTIMSLLGQKRGIIVLTKSDKADADMRALVAEEVKGLVKGTFLETAPVLPVSALTGDGMDALADTINTMVAATPPHEVSGVFRMPIQRIFSAKGFGTVITGVPMSGRAGIGDTLEIIPLGKSGRVRSLQAYKSEVQEIRAGHSSAINLSDVSLEEVHRGMVAATPGYFKASKYVEARFRYVPDKPRTLKNLSPIKLHAGTAEGATAISRCSTGRRSSRGGGLRPVPARRADRRHRGRSLHRTAPDPDVHDRRRKDPRRVGPEARGSGEITLKLVEEGADASAKARRPNSRSGRRAEDTQLQGASLAAKCRSRRPKRGQGPGEKSSRFDPNRIRTPRPSRRDGSPRRPRRELPIKKSLRAGSSTSC
jgi:selenocysteine-specific elongation factor